MSVDEAVDVLNFELYFDAVFCECWRVSLEMLHERCTGNPFYYGCEQMESHCHQAVACYLLEIPNVSRRMNHYCRLALPDPASWVPFHTKVYGSCIS